MGRGGHGGGGFGGHGGGGFGHGGFGHGGFGHGGLFWGPGFGMYGPMWMGLWFGPPWMRGPLIFYLIFVLLYALTFLFANFGPNVTTFILSRYVQYSYSYSTTERSSPCRRTYK